MDAIDQTNNTAANNIPSPEEMLSRLRDINVQTFKMKEVANELKGNKIWISILTIPVSASILVVITLLGSFMFDRPIISFLLAAGLLFWISKMFKHQKQNYKIAARHEVITRIAEKGVEFDLIPHFKHFLPKNYRPTFGNHCERVNTITLNNMFKQSCYYKTNLSLNSSLVYGI